MYDVIKNVINSKDYKLEDILYKINKMWIESAITEEEKTELDSLARQKANINNSIDIISKLKEMDFRLKNCETEIATLKGTQENPEEPEKVTYPEYVPGKWYYRGDNCSENGKNYTCIAPEGKACVWSPSEYPVYWQEVTDSTENSAENAEVVAENTEESEG